MTKRRAERLTGYEIRELPPERGLLTVGAFDGEKLMVKAVGRADFIALQALVNGVYFFNSREAMKQHGWLCARCRSSRKLRSITRKVPKSHGGTHRVENLEPDLPRLPQADPQAGTVPVKCERPKNKKKGQIPLPVKIDVGIWNSYDLPDLWKRTFCDL